MTLLSSKRPMFRLLTLLALVVSALALTAACSSDPTPTPTPSPTPTPTPEPTLTIDADTIWRDVAGALTPAEVSCLRGELGEDAYDALLDEPVLAGGPYLASLPVSCLEQETAIDFIVALLDVQVGGLSSDSETCLRGTFATVDISRLAGLANAPTGDVNDIGAAIGGTVGLAFCLTDEEAAMVSIGDLLGDAMGDITLAQFTCVMEQVDISEVLPLLESLNTGGEFTGPSLEVFQAVADCGIDFNTDGGDAMEEPPSRLGDGAGSDSDPLSLLEGLGPEFGPFTDCLRQNATQAEIDALFSRDLSALRPEAAACFDHISDLADVLERLQSPS